MSAVGGVAAVWLPVADLERAREFYSRRLGLREEQRAGDWAQLDANGLRIGLNRRESPDSGGGGAVVAFQPEDGLEATVERLRDQGVEFAGEISDHPWGRIAAFKDSEGNDLQLYEPPKS